MTTLGAMTTSEVKNIEIVSNETDKTSQTSQRVRDFLKLGMYGELEYIEKYCNAKDVKNIIKDCKGNLGVLAQKVIVEKFGRNKEVIELLINTLGSELSLNAQKALIDTGIERDIDLMIQRFGGVRNLEKEIYEKLPDKYKEV